MNEGSRLYSRVYEENSIRLAKGNVFAEWKNSDTAKLFEDHGYKNKRNYGQISLSIIPF